MKTNWLKRIVPRTLAIIFLLSVIVLPIVYDVQQIHADAVDLYWIGGTGNWSDTAHWATDAGGGGAGHAVPTTSNNVFFGASSFTGAGQVMTIDAGSPVCKSMDWTGVTNTPQMKLSTNFEPQLNVTFSPNMTMLFTSGVTYLRRNQIITTNGLNVSWIIAIDQTANITFADDYTTSRPISFANGSLILNNITLSLASFDISSADAKTLACGSSTINCTAFNVSGSNLTISGTSTIKITGTGVLAGGGTTTFNNVELNGTAHTISGSNTFAKLSFKPAAGQTITFTDTTTQTAASFERTGTGQITFQGSAAAGWALADNNGGTNTFNALTVSRSTVVGATFNATTVSVNGGNNVGWTFVQTASTQPATNITPTTCTVNGTLTDLGGSPATTTVFFQYGATSGLGNTTTPVAQTTPTTFTEVLPMPKSEGGIYFRAGTTCTGGTSYGALMYLDVPSGVGGLLLKNILPIVLAGAIVMVTMLRIPELNPTTIIASVLGGLITYYLAQLFMSAIL